VAGDNPDEVGAEANALTMTSKETCVAAVFDPQPTNVDPVGWYR
jgi:hypothetical protein